MENQRMTMPNAVDLESECRFKTQLRRYQKAREGHRESGKAPEMLKCFACEGTLGYAGERGYKCHTSMN